MPILANITRRPRTSGPNVALVEEWASRFWGPRSYSGPRVSDDEAVEFTTVYRALNVIASTLGTLPIHVFDKRSEVKEPVDTGVARLITTSPNREDTRSTLWSGLIADLVMNGNAFIQVIKNGQETPLSLWAIAPHRVEVGRLGEEFGWLKVYRIDHGTQVERLMFDYSLGGEIIHIMGRPDKNKLVGFDPRRSLYRALGLSRAADDMAGTTWQEQAVPPGILSSDQELSTDTAKTMAERWHARTQGQIAVLGKGLKFERVSLSPLEAETLESRRFSVEDIARHFGIPGQLLGSMEKSQSFASGLEELMNFFRSMTLMHHYVPVEQAIDKHLFGSGNLYMRFELGGLLRGTKLQQYQAMRLALGGAPWMVPDEARALDELAPIEGGDVLNLPLNMGNPGSLPGEDTSEAPENDAQKAIEAAENVILRTVCPDCGGFIGHNARGTIRCPKCNQLKVFA